MSEEQWVAPGSRPPQDPPGSSAPPPAGPRAGPPPGWSAPGWVAPGGSTPPPPGPVPGPVPGSPPRYAPGYDAGYTPDFRPGIIPLRPLLVGDIFDGTIKAIRGNPAATIGLAVLTTLAFLVPATALGAWVASTADPSTFEGSTAEVDLLGTLGGLIPTLSTSVSGILLTGFVAFVVGQGVLGSKVSAGRTWEATKGRLPAIVGATLLTALLLVLAAGLTLGIPVTVLVLAGTGTGAWASVGLIGLVVLGAVATLALTLFLSTRLAFATSAIVLERRGVLEGLRRSWGLTGGRPFWRILGLRLLTALIVGFVGWILTLPISLAVAIIPLALGDFGGVFVWQAVGAGVTALVAGALTTPFTAGVDALLYVDQRIRREGLDVRLLRTFGQGPGPGQGARR